jgi:hypothetical protein
MCNEDIWRISNNESHWSQEGSNRSCMVKELRKNDLWQ